jgi:hypothetical protein
MGLKQAETWLQQLRKDQNERRLKGGGGPAPGRDEQDLLSGDYELEWPGGGSDGEAGSTDRIESTPGLMGLEPDSPSFLDGPPAADLRSGAYL